jgi:signal transduction histidine kinase
MIRTFLAVEFLRSKPGRTFLILLAACATLALVVGIGFHRSTMRWFEASKGEENVTVIELIDAFVATYSDIRGAHLASDATVPATFRADALTRFNRDRDIASSMRVLMVGPPGREIKTPPPDMEGAKAVARFAEEPDPQPETGFITVNGQLLLRTTAPSIATQQSCVDCHNEIQHNRYAWKLRDVVGAFVIDLPAGDFRHQSVVRATQVALLVFVLCGGVALYLCTLQFRRQGEDGRIIEALRVRERELQKAQQDAQAANRTKSQFLANMSHELRTPLNAIIGFSEIISKDMLQLGGPHEYRDYALDINGSGQNLLQIINDILDMSKIDAGKLELREEIFDIAPAIAHCIRMIGGRAHEANVLIVNDLPAEFPHIKADPVRFKQIVLNLLSNAVKFTPGPGTVRIAAEIDADGSMSLLISDTGIGMSADELAIAMQPFRQIDSELSRKHEGTGLGLPLTKSLTELHGGTLRITSEKGRGTEVAVVLPAMRVVLAPPAIAAE